MFLVDLAIGMFFTVNKDNAPVLSINRQENISGGK